MNDALSARNGIKLTQREFALLLGVPVSTVTILEAFSEHRGEVAHSLFVLLTKYLSLTARTLIEERITATASNTHEFAQLAQLAQTLQDGRII